MNLRDPEALGRLPKLVIFDLDDTFYDYDAAHGAATAALAAKAQERLGPSGARFIEALAAARGALKADLGPIAAAHDRLLYMHRAFEGLGLKSQPLLALDFEQTYWRAFLDASTLRDGARALVDTLRSLAIDRALVTDLTTRIQFRKLVYHGLDEAFDYIVTSEEAGADKPDERVWALLRRKIGNIEGPVWAIGDDPIKDIDGPASHFGAIGIQVGGGPPSPRAAATCQSFEGLVEHLRTLVARSRQ
jgi:putative hydrolase of the HAD superfamily